MTSKPILNQSDSIVHNNHVEGLRSTRVCFETISYGFFIRNRKLCLAFI